MPRLARSPRSPRHCCSNGRTCPAECRIRGVVEATGHVHPLEVLGIDAFRGGWVAVVLSDGLLTDTDAHGSLATLVGRHSNARVVAVDMPIGLPTDGHRQCDVQAKNRVGARHNSVFFAPPLEVLQLKEFKAATARAVDLTGSGISRQAHALARGCRKSPKSKTSGSSRFIRRSRSGRSGSRRSLSASTPGTVTTTADDCSSRLGSQFPSRRYPPALAAPGLTMCSMPRLPRGLQPDTPAPLPSRFQATHNQNSGKSSGTESHVTIRPSRLGARHSLRTAE